MRKSGNRFSARIPLYTLWSRSRWFWTESVQNHRDLAFVDAAFKALIRTGPVRRLADCPAARWKRRYSREIARSATLQGWATGTHLPFLRLSRQPPLLTEIKLATNDGASKTSPKLLGREIKPVCS